MKSVLSHIAYLVEKIEDAVSDMNLPMAKLAEIEEFPSEGTRELYIGGPNQMGRLLLMQAIGEGPYKNALDKRGAGLHHIAIDVLSMDEFLSHISGTGWLLHPKSLAMYKSSKTVFLSRPGVPALIEVQERKSLNDSDYFIDRIEFPFGDQRLLNALACKNLKMGKTIKLNFS